MKDQAVYVMLWHLLQGKPQTFTLSIPEYVKNTMLWQFLHENNLVNVVYNTNTYLYTITLTDVGSEAMKYD